MGEYFIKATFEKTLKTPLFYIIRKSAKENNLDFFYKNIDCRLITSTPIDQSGDIRLISDDEGLEKEDLLIWTLFDTIYNVPIEIVGDFILCTSEDTGEGYNFTGFNSIKEAQKAFLQYVKPISIRFLQYSI